MQIFPNELPRFNAASALLLEKIRLVDYGQVLVNQIVFRTSSHLLESNEQ